MTDTPKAPDFVKNLVETIGGDVIEVGGILPDGSGYAAASMPLPAEHWLYDEKSEPPPMPFRMGTEDPRRKEFNNMVRQAAKYAVRASTMKGKESDFDPDAMVQNFVVAMLGYHTPDGLCHDEHVPEFDPDPVPEHYPGVPNR